MIRKFLVIPMVAAAVALGAAVPAGATTTSSNVVQVLAQRSSLSGFDTNAQDYDILIKAAQTAGLVDALASTPNLTVFAPNDAAFLRTARDLGFVGTSESAAWTYLVNALGQIGASTGIGSAVDVLTVVLKYHVAPQRLGVWAMLYKGVTGGSVSTLAGASFGVRYIQLVDLAPARPNPYLNLFALDIKASNGVIHGITRVLLPANV
ncbi:MAG: hypothetical protein RL531_202 [Actinomycetota bacterium]